MSDFRFTPSEIAVLGMVGTLTGAWLGAHVNGRTQRDVSRATINTQRSVAETTLTAQRKLAEDQRLWAERKEVYLQILEDLEHRSDFRDSVNRTDGEEEYAPTAEQWRNLNVRTNAFGSAEVRELLRDSREAYLSWLRLIRERQVVEAGSEGLVNEEALSEINSRAAEAYSSADSADLALVDRIRSELQSN